MIAQTKYYKVDEANGQCLKECEKNYHAKEKDGKWQCEVTKLYQKKAT